MPRRLPRPRKRAGTRPHPGKSTIPKDLFRGPNWPRDWKPDGTASRIHTLLAKRNTVLLTVGDVRVKSVRVSKKQRVIFADATSIGVLLWAGPPAGVDSWIREHSAAIPDVVDQAKRAAEARRAAGTQKPQRRSSIGPTPAEQLRRQDAAAEVLANAQSPSVMATDVRTKWRGSAPPRIREGIESQLQPPLIKTGERADERGEWRGHRYLVRWIRSDHGPYNATVELLR